MIKYILIIAIVLLTLSSCGNKEDCNGKKCRTITSVPG